MRDVTGVLFDYLEAKRHLWNVYFSGKVDSLHECSPLDEYEEIDRLLFSGLVARTINGDSLPDDLAFGKDPIKFLQIRPRDGLDALLMNVGEKTSALGSYSWSESKNFDFPKNNMTLYFISFFDWNRYQFASYSLCRARVIESKNSDLVGKDILVDIGSIKIIGL